MVSHRGHHRRSLGYSPEHRSTQYHTVQCRQRFVALVGSTGKGKQHRGSEWGDVTNLHLRSNCSIYLTINPNYATLPISRTTRQHLGE